MKITNDKGAPITTLDEWMTLGGPAGGEKHWKPGRSARELAVAWLGDAPAIVTQVLSETVPGLQLERAWAERKTRFDHIPGGKRNHDLLVLGHADAGKVVIGVEGKADEGFGRPVGEHVAKTLEKSPASRLPERADALMRAFVGQPLGVEATLDGVGYQLFSALAGTLTEAKDHDAAIAVLLVHEFDDGSLSAKRQAANAAQLDALVTALGGKLDGVPDRLLSQPVSVRGANDLMPDSTPVVIAKLRTRVARSAALLRPAAGSV